MSHKIGYFKVVERKPISYPRRCEGCGEVFASEKEWWSEAHGQMHRVGYAAAKINEKTIWVP